MTSYQLSGNENRELCQRLKARQIFLNSPGSCAGETVFSHLAVMPAKAGSHLVDSRLRGNDNGVPITELTGDELRSLRARVDGFDD